MVANEFREPHAAAWIGELYFRDEVETCATGSGTRGRGVDRRSCRNHREAVSGCGGEGVPLSESDPSESRHRPPASGHRFGPDLICSECGISWEQHQSRPNPCDHVGKADSDDEALPAPPSPVFERADEG